MNIRRFASGDAQAVSDVIITTLRISNTRDYPPDMMEELILHMQPEDILKRASWTHFYVAEDAGKIIGCGAIGPYWGKEDESSLFTIFVLPEYQGRGVGRRIVETLEQDEYALRAKRIEIPASITGLPFYRKMGYTFKNGNDQVDDEMLYRLEKFQKPKMEECSIARAKPGDEQTLAYIQTESWKSAFQGILSDDELVRCTNLDKATAMYKRELDNRIGYGYILRVNGEPHCIAWWNAARLQDMPGYAELICIHSLPGNWRKGYGSQMMRAVLRDMAAAGYKNVMLWVFEANVRARRFYEAMGFVTYGKVKPGIVPAEICYERSLEGTE